MSKDIMISFRTTTQLNESLKKMAKENNTTLSGLIDSVLDDYLSSRAAQEILDQDRRKFSRQDENIPAIVEHESGAFQTARITSLSLGGASLTVLQTADAAQKINPDQQFQAAFPLPGAKHPVVVLCQATWVHPAADTLQVGVVFHDADPASYQTLLMYLS